MPPADTLSTLLVLTDGRPPADVQFERELVALFMEAADLLGVPRSVAAIYGICFASPEPVGFTEIQQRLNISAGSISQGLRILREIGALKVSSNRVLAGNGQRRGDRFEPDLALRKLISRYIDERLQKQLKSGKGRLDLIANKIPPGRNGSRKLLRSRIKALQAWHDKTRAVLPIVKSFLALG